MTDRIPEIFHSEFKDLDIDGLDLNSILTSDPDKNPFDDRRYKFKTQPDKSICETLIYSTACPKGYLEHYFLTQSGQLILSKYEFLTSDNKPVFQEVNEVANGDFWIRFGAGLNSFYDFYIPFKDGIIVDSMDEWLGYSP